MNGSGKKGSLRTVWLGVAGGLYLVVSLVNGTTGQTPGSLEGIGGGYPQGTQQAVALDAGQFDMSQFAPRGPEARTAAGSAEMVTPMVAGDGFLAFASPDGAGGFRVVLIHCESQAMSVYGVGSEGRIQLLSARPLRQDFGLRYDEKEPTSLQIEQLRQRDP